MLSKRHCRLTLICGSALALGACASIIHGGHQEVRISSAPSSATVTIDGHARGTTPVTASLARKDHHAVRIELAGYQPFETTLTRKVSGWVWGNVVFGGLVGLAVDAIGGGMYKLSPDDVSAQLASGHANVVANDGTLLLAVVMHPGPGWERVGQLVPVTAEPATSGT